MPRPLRTDTPGSLHHITNRGVAHRTVFESRREVRFFLSRIAKVVRRGWIELHAYCILPNHFHVLVRSVVRGREGPPEAGCRIRRTRSP